MCQASRLFNIIVASFMTFHIIVLSLKDIFQNCAELQGSHPGGAPLTGVQHQDRKLQQLSGGLNNGSFLGICPPSEYTYSLK